MSILDDPVEELPDNERILAVHFISRFKQLSDVFEVLQQQGVDAVDRGTDTDTEELDDIGGDEIGTASAQNIAEILENARENETEKVVTQALGEQASHMYEFYLTAAESVDNNQITPAQAAEKIVNIEEDINWLPKLTDSRVRELITSGRVEE